MHAYQLHKAPLAVPFLCHCETQGSVGTANVLRRGVHRCDGPAVLHSHLEGVYLISGTGRDDSGKYAYLISGTTGRSRKF